MKYSNAIKFYNALNLLSSHICCRGLQHGNDYITRFNRNMSGGLTWDYIGNHDVKLSLLILLFIAEWINKLRFSTWFAKAFGTDWNLIEKKK